MKHICKGANKKNVIHVYDAAHIRGSISIPVGMTPEIPKYDSLLKNKILITYCHGVGCHLFDKVAYKLFDYGYKNVAIFFGGWNQWYSKKYAVSKGPEK